MTDAEIYQIELDARRAKSRNLKKQRRNQRITAYQRVKDEWRFQKDLEKEAKKNARK